jgi:hypothetical protein
MKKMTGTVYIMEFGLRTIRTTRGRGSCRTKINIIGCTKRAGTSQKVGFDTENSMIVMCNKVEN